MSEYERQVEDFLAEHGIKFNAAFKGDKCPLWCDGGHIHGDRYLITFSRRLGDRMKRFSLSFWNSLKDMEEGNKPHPYDVLAAIQKYDPGTLEDFCSGFGYDADSIKANKTYKAVCLEWDKVAGFFSLDELSELQEIQ